MKRDVDAAWVALAAFVAYLGNLANGFVYDDRYIVERNPLVQNLDWRGLLTSSYWGDIVYAGLYRPVTMLTYGLNRAVSESAIGFHLVNNLLHAAVSVLVLWSARALGATRFVSVTAALLFALHPIQSEAVTAIVGRSDLLALGLTLAAFVVYSRGEHPWAAGALIFLAAGSKESAFFALTVFGAHALFYERRNLAPIVSAALGALALRLWLVDVSARSVGFLDNPAASAPLITRILTAFALFFEYVSQILWPRTLSADYSFNQIPLATGIDGRVLAGLVIVVALAVVAIRNRGLTATAALTFSIPIGLVLHILFPIGTLFAERLTYIPMFGASLLMALGLARLGRHRAWLAGAILIACAARTGVRNLDWKDNETLFRKTIETSPNSARAYFLLGTELLEQERFDASARAFEGGLTLYPRHPGAQMSLGEALLAAGDVEGAADRFRVGFFQQPSDAARDRATTTAMSAGRAHARRGDWELAKKSFESVLDMKPGSSEAMNQLGLIAEREGKLDEAERHYESVLALDPAYVPTVVNLASVRMQTGDLSEAEALYRRAISFAPESYEAYNGLGIALARQGRPGEAEQAFRRAVTIDPALQAARDNLRALGIP